MIDFTPIVEAIIALATTAITVFLIPWLRERYGNRRFRASSCEGIVLKRTHTANQDFERPLREEVAFKRPRSGGGRSRREGTGHSPDLTYLRHNDVQIVLHLRKNGFKMEAYNSNIR